MAKNKKWGQLAGMDEDKAETHMLKNWGAIPPKWNDPLFRNEVLGAAGLAEVSALMSNGTQSYESGARLGADAEGFMFRRNVEGQGAAVEAEWVKRKQQNTNNG